MRKIFQLARLLECAEEASPTGWAPNPPTCWLREDLPDKLNEGNLDDYTLDLDAYGPHKPRNNPQIMYRSKWAPGFDQIDPAKLIQLAFHDCLRYDA